MAPYYSELLKLCGFEEEEITGQQHRIESAFKKLDLGPKDMEKAAGRVKKYFDIELRGVRKILGVWIKELIDLVLAREEGKKLIYYGYPPFQYTGLAIKAAAAAQGEFWIGCPEMIFCQTFGQIFNKLIPILEEGEAQGLPPGHAMCSLLQIKNGALSKKMIPTPDLSIATSYFCDMGPKADELMQHRYGGYPVLYVDSCLDSPWGEWPDFDQERVHYFGKQLNGLFRSLKDLLGIEIDNDVWYGARNLAAPLFMATNNLAMLLASDPVPLDIADSELVINLPAAGMGVAIEEGAEAVEILVEEVKKRVEEGFGVVPRNAPRVLLTFQSLVDPVFNRLFSEVGLAVPSIYVLLPPPNKPKSLPYPTLGEKRAEVAMFGGMYHSSYGLIKRMQECIAFTQVDGVVYNYHYSCRPLTCNSKLVKPFIERESKLPTLLLDMDYYDDRNYSAAALRTRLEAFAEMLKAKKATA